MQRDVPKLTRDKRSRNIVILKLLLELEYGFDENIQSRISEETKVAEVVKKCFLMKMTPSKAAEKIDKLVKKIW